VTQGDRERRAKEIAEKLSDYTVWHSHARPIPMHVLVNDLNLRIDDYRAKKELGEKVDHYFSFMTDLMEREQIPHLVHTKSHI